MIFFRLFPRWAAVVRLKCDQSRKAGDGEFVYTGSKDNNWVRRTANNENKIIKSACKASIFPSRSSNLWNFKVSTRFTKLYFLRTGLTNEHR